MEASTVVKLEDAISEEDKALLNEIRKQNLSQGEIGTVLKNLRSINPRKYSTVKIDFPEKHVKFGYFSDAHMGHKHFRQDVFDYMVADFKRQKVDFVVNAGDTIEGMSNREGHVFELDYIGMDAQLKFFKEQFQKLYLWDVYSIEADSSHGGWSRNKGNQGFNIGEELHMRAPNYAFIGFDEQDIELDNGLKIRLRHPGDGIAYAVSYKMQQYVNSISGGNKPNILIEGHYHKAMYMFYRNIHCVDGNTKIRTKNGTKKIRDVSVGDEVLTHKNRFRRVTQTMNRKCDGEFVKLFFRNLDECSCTLNTTPEHPVLIERNNEIIWLKAKDVVEGDILQIMYTECKHCGKHIPYYNKCCSDCVDMRKKDMQMCSQKRYYPSPPKGNKHYQEDIVPKAKELKEQGYEVFPLGAVVPDIIAFKEGKIYAYEVENRHISYGKKAKYEGHEFVDFFDEIIWDVQKKGNKENIFRKHEENEYGFIKMPVLKVKHHKKRNTKVYNLEVEEDNSYIASGVVVHNCFEGATIQQQSPFMKKKGTPAMIGYGTIDAYMQDDGGVERLIHEFVPFYD